MRSTILLNLQKLNIILPIPSVPVENYLPYTFTPDKDMIFISGQLPIDNNQVSYVGRIGEVYNLDDGQKAARLCCINVLSQLQAACNGNLDIVSRCLKITGFVNATPNYTKHSQIINGASNLIVEVFGKQGMHARSVVGVSSLPFGVPVVVEAIFVLKQPITESKNL